MHEFILGPCKLDLLLLFRPLGQHFAHILIHIMCGFRMIYQLFLLEPGKFLRNKLFELGFFALNECLALGLVQPLHVPDLCFVFLL